LSTSCHTYAGVTSHLCMSHVTRMNESHHSDKDDMLHIQRSHMTHTKESCDTYKGVM